MRRIGAIAILLLLTACDQTGGKMLLRTCAGTWESLYVDAQGHKFYGDSIDMDELAPQADDHQVCRP